MAALTPGWGFHTPRLCQKELIHRDRLPAIPQRIRESCPRDAVQGQALRRAQQFLGAW